MTHRLVFVTLGVMKEPRGQPAMRGFLDHISAVYASAERSAGFFAQETWEASRGPLVAPRCVPAEVTVGQLVMMLASGTV